ncbi:hypothetical protein NK918_24700, partial [Salmonella enterica subsp. enterica serovar Typhimurium]
MIGVVPNGLLAPGAEYTVYTAPVPDPPALTVTVCPAHTTEPLTATEGLAGDALTLMVRVWEAAHGI